MGGTADGFIGFFSGYLAAAMVGQVEVQIAKYGCRPEKRPRVGH